MRTIPVTILYNKTGQEPITHTMILKVQEWAATYPEYLDSKIFNNATHLAWLSRGWHMVEYSYDPSL